MKIERILSELDIDLSSEDWWENALEYLQQLTIKFNANNHEANHHSVELTKVKRNRDRKCY